MSAEAKKVLAFIRKQYDAAKRSGDGPELVDQWLEELAVGAVFANNIGLPIGVVSSKSVKQALAELAA